MGEDGDRKSKFNAGVAQTERIHALQNAINMAKFNPLAKNYDTQTYNYENLITAADNLVSEGWGKFNDKEKELSLRMLKILKDLNKYYPPMTINKNNEIKINKENYEKILDFFGVFERKIKELYDAHNLNAPSMDEDDEGL